MKYKKKKKKKKERNNKRKAPAAFDDCVGIAPRYLFVSSPNNDDMRHRWLLIFQ